VTRQRRKLRGKPKSLMINVADLQLFRKNPGLIVKTAYH